MTFAKCSDEIYTPADHQKTQLDENFRSIRFQSRYLRFDTNAQKQLLLQTRSGKRSGK